MKLLRAQFENFRLLRNLELIFSTDKNRNLTVIRAANETGKTTILNALQWALYGDLSLPGKGSSYRLHPIDWDIDQGKSIPISVTVDFEVTNLRKRGNQVSETQTEYRIIRSAHEEILDDNWHRTPPTVKLYRITNKGAEQIETPESLINDELPPELREIFFTDGDRALSFIEADVSLSTKRNRVQKAIRSLLGLDVINESIRHVKKSSQEVNKRAKTLGGSKNIDEIADRLNLIEAEIEENSEASEDAKQQFYNIEDKIKDIDKKIEAALKKGDKEKLAVELSNLKSQIENLDNRIAAAKKEHSNMFRGKAVAVDLLQPVLDTAFSKLNKLEKRGDIPNTTIPILQERIKKKICICGETLNPNDEAGAKRKRFIENLINESIEADEVKKIITEIYYRSKSLQKDANNAESLWLSDYKKIVELRDELEIIRDKLGTKKKGIELEIDQLPNTDIKGLRDAKRQCRTQRDRLIQKETKFETKTQNLTDERKRLKEELNILLKQQERGDLILSELSVIADILSVLQNSYDQITTDELVQVSDKMNTIFLEMIGSDPDQGAVIKKAEISQDFDIIVFGPKNRTLDPDRDLNGASRRALTLAFILALTIVSEVEAPNVIDTPLGMMS